MRRMTALSFAALLVTPAAAHTGPGAHEGFFQGFVHPLLGLDHVLAMVAVGLWAALVGGRALWAWPSSFVAVMLVGAAVSNSGLPLSGIETFIALSVVVLGGAVALRAAPSVVAGMAVCGAFAFAHGFAHGVEFPAGAALSLYMAGFASATALLHAIGLGIGLALPRLQATWAPRFAGGAVALAGLALLVG